MFSERLKKLRDEKGLTQSQLAHELCISNKTISVYEKGTSLQTIDTLERIASYFDVTVDYLIGYSDERNPEISNIASKLYLSQEAILILKQMAEQINLSTDEPLTSTLSKVIVNPHFNNFLSGLSTFASYTEQDWDNMRKSLDKNLSDDLGSAYKNNITQSMIKSMVRSQIGNEIDSIIDSFIEPPTTE